MKIKKFDEICIIENWLSELDLDNFNFFLKQVPEETWWNHDYEDVQFWNGRFYNAHEVYRSYEPYIAYRMIENRKRIKQFISKQYNKPEIFSDLCQFVRWFDGYELHPHADSEEPNGEPHPFPYREYASITYLNDDFVGGQIYFPNKDNFSPIIKPGMTVIFPGTLEYLHGVREVTNGVRYTLASFYTTDKTHDDRQDENIGLAFG